MVTKDGSGNRISGGQDDPALDRLEEQIRWYSGSSRRCQRRYRGLRGTTILAAAVIPVATVFSSPQWVAAILGAAIVILSAAIVAIEGIQQLNQYQSLWINYRATAEALKHEQYLYSLAVEPTQVTETPIACLPNAWKD